MKGPHGKSRYISVATWAGGVIGAKTLSAELGEAKAENGLIMSTTPALDVTGREVTQTGHQLLRQLSTLSGFSYVAALTRIR